MKEVEEAIDRVMAGPERKTRVMSERERRMIAYHDRATRSSRILPNTDPVHKISVVPRVDARSGTRSRCPRRTVPHDPRGAHRRARDAAGGRVAEELIVGDITTGAANDIERATKVARQMVTEYGMSDTIGLLTLGQKQHEVFLGRDYTAQPDYSDQVAFEIDNEVRRLIDDAHDEALEILQGNRVKLDQLAALLVEKETLERDEVEAFLEIPRPSAIRRSAAQASRSRAGRSARPDTPTPGTIPPKPVG